MKQEFEDLPDIGEAWIAAVEFNGPVDPALIKLKHDSNVKEIKERREQESDLRERHSLARDNHDSDRRDHQTRTLAWLLANDRAYREAHERAMLSFTNAGNAIDRAIEAGEKAHKTVRQQIDDYLASTARLKDGRHVMIAPDGTYRDEDGKPISPEDIAEAEGQPIRAFEPYEQMTERRAQIEQDLTELRGWGVEVGDMKNRALDKENPTREEALAEDKARADDLATRAEEKQRGFEADAPNTDANRHLDLLERKESTATMAMPQLP